jgi:hypothetical protein
MPERILCCLLALVPFAVAETAPVKVPVTRDAWLSSYRTEREGNNGASPKLKLKSIQEFFLIDFDPAPFRGKRVLRAELHLHGEGAETLGRITVSSISDEWVEGTGSNYAKVPGASSFLWARTGEARWGGDAPDITGVVLGQRGSVWGFGDATPRDADGWQIIPIDPKVVQARLDGGSHGFFVFDDVGSEYTREGNTINYKQFPNRYVTSREGPNRYQPYFTLWLEDAKSGDAPIVPAPKPVIKAAKLPEAMPESRKQSLPWECFDEFGQSLPALEFFAARGESVGFGIGAENVACSLPGLKTKTFSMPKIAGSRDPLVPAGHPDAPLKGGESFIDIYVPKDTAAGSYAGELSVGGQKAPFVVHVWNFTLPDRLSFVPQMNCYSLPDHERDYYRLAHENRTTLNCLPYGWTGKVKFDRKVTPFTKDGSWDWRGWDAEYGPLFDGSAFADLPRAGVPIEAFYLPLNENWPMDHEKHFRGGYWIESAYDDDYWREFRAAAAEFAGHFAAKGWAEPMFEFLMNNKVYFKRDRGNRWDACSAPWIFDEPVNTQDFWALRRFGMEFCKGVAAHPEAHLYFRVDVSRPEWQRDLWDGIASIEVVSASLRTCHESVMQRAAANHQLIYMYGSSNKIGTSNAMPAAWCVETWAMGADGVLPWQTIGKRDAWEKPDELSLFYPTPSGPVPSLRLKSYRAGEQLVEYLTMYATLSGQSRESVGAAVSAEPGLRPTLEKKSEADAGRSVFGDEAGRSLQKLKQRLGRWLDQQKPAPRERWHDPRPAPAALDKVRVIEPLPMPKLQA